ncbi:MAG: type II toxin-antitoxin system VapC family toxin [Ferruginibacter sp.]|nr:type II toxin-antitoxin system VapC family toxin [Ferruginibacter sp.]
MSGIKYLADTNILLYIISGNSNIKSYINADFYISEITEIELLGNKGVSKEILEIRKEAIDESAIVGITEQIKQITIHLKQIYTLKIPDAIIAATSIYLNLPLLTADKDFKKIKELDLILISP